jgi:hypothetical protein
VQNLVQGKAVACDALQPASMHCVVRASPLTCPAASSILLSQALHPVQQMLPSPSLYRLQQSR